MAITDELRQQLLSYQRNEITEHHIYKKLASAVKCPDNSKVLADIAADELRHYKEWKNYTEADVQPDRVKVWFYYLVSRVFGFTFGVKLMERGEEGAQVNYSQLEDTIEASAAIAHDENDHEQALLGMLDEERLRYVGSIVLGLNDALVELTGALAGLTLALQNTRLIALTGSITGIAAALSMGASEYLSTKAEDTTKEPLRASVYTGVAYIITVLTLVAPYLMLDNYYICLGWTLGAAVLIIAFFNYYVSVAQDESFKKRFFEMAGVSFGVAGFSFLVGYVLRAFLGVDV